MTRETRERQMFLDQKSTMQVLPVMELRKVRLSLSTLLHNLSMSGLRNKTNDTLT